MKGGKESRGRQMPYERTDRNEREKEREHEMALESNAGVSMRVENLFNASSLSLS